MPSSWSDVPLDLLTSIKNKLQLSQRSDLKSFRSVCSQWYSVVPVPNPCPRYNVEFDNDTNIIHLAMDNNSCSSRNHFIPLPFSSSPLHFFCSSNGWLVFATRNNKVLYLYDPVSNCKLIFPPLYPKMLRYYRKVKLIAHDACHLQLEKIVVSSSIDKGTAVAGIVAISNRINCRDRRFVFCKHAYGDCQRWS
ncbi:hypothetical protein IEQ34_023090 [Dendrobium chrysotoxum]|uniref:KIB1-4 beta-propeller domain-containing protein n=1 Tax=Dendrobium chrysotoxum TaxID=161865 RepID=A0AAV7FZC5_DENCH|nr:hypothetical protein IEQ34_023090 [Dendrobium chrysotoxum]